MSAAVGRAVRCRGRIAPRADLRLCRQRGCGALPEVVFVPSFTLLFAAGTTLTVRLIVELDEGGTPEAVQYSFHFQAARRSWRYCRNPHHVEEDGSECHLHLPDGRRQPLKGPVSFEQIYEMVTVENAAQAGEQRRVDAGEASMDRMRSS